VKRAAIILAAGVGRRLAPLTARAPKALVLVGGSPLLGRQLRALKEAGFPRVVIVTGYRSELVEAFVNRREWGLAVTCKRNPRFRTTNNIVSLLTVREALEDGFCLLNSDIIFDHSILNDVARKDQGNWLVVDTDEPLGAEEMKVELDSHGVISRVSKGLSPAGSGGEYIGIAVFDPQGAATIIESARRLVAQHHTDLYYEDAIDAVTDQLLPRAIETRGRLWTEIDDVEDYARASVIAAKLDASPSRC
jgi:choline kinase